MLFDRRLSLTLVLLFFYAFGSASFAASLAYSTYLKDGFTPKAMVSDAQGNLYLAGQAVTDPVAGAKSVVVAKIDPRASEFLYLAYLDSTTLDDVRAMAVDTAGNVYVAGSTANPNFPATGGGRLGTLGTLPMGPQDARSFVTKLSPSGIVIFSVLVGGSASSKIEAIALTPQGQIVVSGESFSSGFPVTAGAYTIADSNRHPFLMELDPIAATVVFSATGIGGSSLALDSSGNIYVSGSTGQLDYPTTPGAYQPTFTPSLFCIGMCQISFGGSQQYLSKVNPTGSKLIYSTGINGTKPNRSGSTQNIGLAVDTAGNAYVTGVLDGSDAYPFTTAVPDALPYEYGYLTKLDAAGANVLYSFPFGGGGVKIDAQGAVYVAGTVTTFNSGGYPNAIPVAIPSPLTWVPPQCRPNSVSATSEAYLIKLDAPSGGVLDSQWIDGSALNASALTLASGKVWIAGATQFADVPITPGALSPPNLPSGVLPGTYLSAVDFPQPNSSGNGFPQIACVLDGGNQMHAGPVASNQLLTLFGVNLGPAAGVSSADSLDSSIAGVTVTFDGVPAQLLFVSSSQINLLTPASFQQKTVMQVSVNGITTNPRQLPLIGSNPNLFADLLQNGTTCGVPPGLSPLATNADGSRNSCSNPAKLGSIVSFYVHGILTPACFCFDATIGSGSSAAVVNVTAVNTFVTRVDVQLPNSFATANGRGIGSNSVPFGFFQMGLRYNQMPVGPLPLPDINVIIVNRTLDVWATQ